MKDISESNFISVAAHQLRTPLTPIRWFAKLLLSGEAGDLNAEQKEFVQYIYDNNDRMITLLNTLLQIVRAEEGKQEIKTSPEDIIEFVNKVVVSLTPLAQAKGISINVHEPAFALPQVPIDEVMTWQVLQNLISNAIRYSSDGGEIEIDLVKIEKEIQISVKDHGIGIPKEMSGRIYEKFFRTPVAAKMVPEGSGLGLSLARSLTQSWGGKLWHESTEGKGTTFHFTIPLK